MHFFTKLLHASVVLHVAFQGAYGGILRGRAGDTDAVQLLASESQLSTRNAALAKDVESLDKQMGEFLRTWHAGHIRPNHVETASIAKRQAGNIQIPEQALQELLRLIKSIETQLTSIIASGTSPTGGVVQPPANTGSSPGPVPSPPVQPPMQSPPMQSPPVQSPPVWSPPVQSPPMQSPPMQSPPVQSPPAWSPPVQSPPVQSPPAWSPPVQMFNPPVPTQGNPDVGPPIPSPFLTNPGTGPRDPPTTAYGMATSTGTRCKTTLTRTFTAYVYEDGSPAAGRKARSVDDDADGSEESGSEAPEEEPEQGSKDVTELEPWAELDGSTTADGKLEPGHSVAALWSRESRKSPGSSKLLFVRDAEDALEMAAF